MTFYFFNVVNIFETEEVKYASVHDSPVLLPKYLEETEGISYRRFELSKVLRGHFKEYFFNHLPAPDKVNMSCFYCTSKLLSPRMKATRKRKLSLCDPMTS